MGICRRLRLVLEYFTGVSALVGGVLLAGRPDGTLLRADASALASSPFDDWRVPGLLLATLVGCGFVVTAECQRRRWPHERDLAVVAGTGLIVFELAELAWIGFQPLEAVFVVVGATIAGLALLERASVDRTGRSHVSSGHPVRIGQGRQS